MSYDLLFWRQQQMIDLQPSEILGLIAEDGGPIAGLIDIPVDDFLARVVEAFPTVEREPDGQLCWVSADERVSFQIESSPQFVWVFMRGPWPNEIPNTLIDIAAEF